MVELSQRKNTLLGSLDLQHDIIPHNISSKNYDWAGKDTTLIDQFFWRNNAKNGIHVYANMLVVIRTRGVWSINNAIGSLVAGRSN